jgi:hypothetical protein
MLPLPWSFSVSVKTTQPPTGDANSPTAVLYAVSHRTGKDTVSVVLGEVVLAHIAEGVAGRSPTGKLVVDPVKLAPVCRLGGFTYGRVTELYDIRRPGKDGVYPRAAQQKSPSSS